MSEIPCPECGSYNQKTSYVRRTQIGYQTIDLYEVECRECGDTWDDEHVVEQS